MLLLSVVVVVVSDLLVFLLVCCLLLPLSLTYSDTATNTVDFGLDQLDVKRKHKEALGEDFGIRIYLSDGNYTDVTKGLTESNDEGIEMGETRLQQYTEVDQEGNEKDTAL